MISNTSIPSITTGPRQSNFELLRILAMLLVLVLHCNFWPIGIPDAADFHDAPLTTWTRTLFQSAAIVCVNVFILISGWFKIKVSLKGFFNFIFQCLFFSFGTYLVMFCLGKAPFSLTIIAECLGISKVEWFIKSYIGLYILAPALNIFSDKASRKQLFWVLVAFFTFQTIYGMTMTAQFIQRGYSTFSFIGLYLLARYMRLYPSRILSRLSLWSYLGSVGVLSVLFYINQMIKSPLDMYAYINPLIIFSSMGLFLTFGNIKMRTSPVINTISRSSFAIYLLHYSPVILQPVFLPTARRIFENYSGAGYFGAISLFIIVVSLTAILTDQLRIWLWRRIQCIFNYQR